MSATCLQLILTRQYFNSAQLNLSSKLTLSDSEIQKQKLTSVHKLELHKTCAVISKKKFTLKAYSYFEKFLK